MQKVILPHVNLGKADHINSHNQINSITYSTIVSKSCTHALTFFPLVFIKVRAASVLMNLDYHWHNLLFLVNLELSIYQTLP